MGFFDKNPGVATFPRPGMGISLSSVGNLPTAVLQRLPGYKFSYVEMPAGNLSVTATTEATAQTAVTAAAVTFDGKTEVKIEFFCENTVKGTTYLVFVLYDGSSSLGFIGRSSSANVTVKGERLLTTLAGSTHTYSVRAFVDAGTGTVVSGGGGAGQSLPTFIRITHA